MKTIQTKLAEIINAIKYFFKRIWCCVFRKKSLVKITLNDRCLKPGYIISMPNKSELLYLGANYFLQLKAKYADNKN